MNMLNRNACTLFCILLPMMSLGAEDDWKVSVRASIKAMHESLLGKDPKAFLVTVTGGEGYEKLATSSHEYVQAAIAFEDALKARFGNDGVAQYNDVKLENRMNFRFRAPPRTAEWIDEIEIRREGEEAVYTDPTWRVQVWVKQDPVGKWKVVLDRGTFESYEAAAKGMNDLASILKRATQKLSDEKDLSLEKLKIFVSELLVASQN